MAKKEKNQLKLTFWDKLGGFFRASTILTGVGAVLNPVFKFLVAPRIAESGSDLAPQISKISSSLWNGYGAAEWLIYLAVPAVGATIAYAIPPVREYMKQRALLKKLQKALTKNKELTLTPEQVQILNKALDNPRMKNLVDKIGRERLGEVAKTASTKAPVASDPHNGHGKFFLFSLFPR